MIKKILVAEDDREDLEFFLEAVKELNSTITVEIACDGIQALEILSDTGGMLPDIIFMDINMPRMGGKECLAKIKNKDQLKDIEVVMLSTSSSGQDMHDSLRLGASDYLVKPVSLESLKQGLSRFLY